MGKGTADLAAQRKQRDFGIQRALRCSFCVSPIAEKPGKAGNSREIREQFSELQTDWRWMQSPANRSLPKIPVNREKYREIDATFDPEDIQYVDFIGRLTAFLADGANS
jgi:hypothetical protein